MFLNDRPEGFTNFGEYLSGTMFANAGTGVRQAMDEIQIALEHEFKKLINENQEDFLIISLTLLITLTDKK